MRLILAALVVFVVVASAQTSAACRWFGTQLHCDAGDSLVVLGTQGADDPHYASSVPPLALLGNGRFVDGPKPTNRFQVQVQNIGVDPRLCRRIGNETYCY